MKDDRKFIYFEDELRTIEICTKKSQDVVLGKTDEGRFYIGIRNQYGNAPRFVPFDSIIDLFWGKYGKDNIEKLENEKDLKIK